MWPSIGPIKAYGMLYLLGIVLHFAIAWRMAKHFGLKRRVWITTSVCYMLGMMAGAKLLFDLRHNMLDLSALFRVEHWLQGGLWGGLLAYFALAVPLAVLLFRPRTAVLDLVALTIPIPWMAAKLGCFLNGCCYGRPCTLPWAVVFPQGSRDAPAGIPLHPTQLYEVGIMLILLLIFSQLKSDRWQGTRLLWFLAVYGFGRAATDFLRGDTEGPLYLGLLSLTQLLSVASAVVALLLLGLHLHGMNCRAQLSPGN
jgi:phosphatidylglycerol:prolipoprotein diacylglycerol transferase